MKIDRALQIIQIALLAWIAFHVSDMPGTFWIEKSLSAIDRNTETMARSLSH